MVEETIEGDPLLHHSLPGRVVNHARLLRIKIGGAAAFSRLRDIRTRIAALA